MTTMMFSLREWKFDTASMAHVPVLPCWCRVRCKHCISFFELGKLVAFRFQNSHCILNHGEKESFWSAVSTRPSTFGMETDSNSSIDDTHFDCRIFIVGAKGECPCLNQLKHFCFDIFMWCLFDQLGKGFTIFTRCNLIVDGWTAILNNTFEHKQCVISSVWIGWH